MKQFEACGYTVFYQSALGEVHLQKDGPGCPGYSLPAEVLIEFVGMLVMEEKVRKLEQMPARELLGLPEKYT